MTARAAEPLRLVAVGHSNHPWGHFLGRELGARSRIPSVYRDGRADYVRLAATPSFRDGELETHEAVEARLLALPRTAPPPLLDTEAERRAALERAYAIRSRAIAYAGPPDSPTGRWTRPAGWATMGPEGMPCVGGNS